MNNKKKYESMKDILTEQKISKVVTISGGSSDVIEFKIPRGRTAFLMGYGYDWYEDTEYTLNVGSQGFPKRKDQEGSIAQPVMWSIPFPILSGQYVRLVINNTGSSSQTYKAVFFLKTDGILDIESDGGELVVATGSATGSVNSSSITNQAGSVYVDVVNDGTTNRLCVDTELEVTSATINNIKNLSTDGTKNNLRYGRVDSSDNQLVVEQGQSLTPTHSSISVGTSSTSVLSSNSSRKNVLIQNISDTNIFINLGGTATLNNGILIQPNASYEISYMQGNLFTGSISAICSASGKSLIVTEFQ